MNISVASISTASIQSFFGPLYSEEGEVNVVRTITATVKDDGNKSYFAMIFDISLSYLFKDIAKSEFDFVLDRYR